MPGVRGPGRPAVRPDARHTRGGGRQAQQLYDSGTPVPKIARTFKAAPATIYRHITLKTAR
ncbi:helix-turn-helix domain-containing protein [Streptomyces sp. NPDC002845]